MHLFQLSLERVHFSLNLKIQTSDNTAYIRSIVRVNEKFKNSAEYHRIRPSVSLSFEVGLRKVYSVPVDIFQILNEVVENLTLRSSTS